MTRDEYVEKANAFLTNLDEVDPDNLAQALAGFEVMTDEEYAESGRPWALKYRYRT